MTEWPNNRIITAVLSYTTAELNLREDERKIADTQEQKKKDQSIVQKRKARHQISVMPNTEILFSKSKNWLLIN